MTITSPRSTPVAAPNPVATTRSNSTGTSATGSAIDCNTGISAVMNTSATARPPRRDRGAGSAAARAYVAREEAELAGLAPGQRDRLGDLLGKLLNTLES